MASLFDGVIVTCSWAESQPSFRFGSRDHPGAQVCDPWAALMVIGAGTGIGNTVLGSKIELRRVANFLRWSTYCWGY